MHINRMSMELLSVGQRLPTLLIKLIHLDVYDYEHGFFYHYIVISHR